MTTERLQELTAAAVGLGLSVHELRRSYRAVMLRAGVRDVTRQEWQAVRERLDRAAQRAGSGRCSSCRAWVLWGTTARGKSMPLDPLPHPRGNVTIERSPAGGVSVTVHSRSALPLPPPAYRTHFVSCPRARGGPAERSMAEVSIAWALEHDACTWCLYRLDSYWLDQGLVRHGPCAEEAERYPRGSIQAEVVAWR